MSRTTGDPEIDNLILSRLQSPNFKSRLELDYWDGTDWVYEDSLSIEDGISWTDSVKRRKYLNFGVQPICNDLSFVIENRDGRFSPGSGEPEDNRYDIDTKVRIRHIYPMDKEFLTDEDGNFLTDEDGNKLYNQREYTLYYSVFYCDEVSYNVNNVDTDTVSIKARDVYRNAIEKDILLPDLTGLYLHEVIELVCDQIGIQYSPTSIADLTTFGARTLATGLDQPEKADDIFEIIMSIINQNGSSGYQMYLAYDDTYNDNILYVQPIPSLYEADFAFSENHIMQLGSFTRDRSRFLQRMTCLQESAVPNEREQLASTTYNTNGQKTLTLSKNSLYRTYTVTVNSGSPTVTLDQVNAGSLIFTIANAGSVTITVYGVGFDSYPTISGESINHANMVNNVGQTSKIESKLFESATECRLVAEGIIQKYGSPDKEAQGLEYPYCNTFLINNDMVFPFIRNIFENDLYYIVGIKHNWSFEDESTFFDLQDSGLNWLDVYDGFIYDSALYRTLGIDGQDSSNMRYDIGFVYDMDFGPNAKANDIITTTRNEYIYDVGEA